MLSQTGKADSVLRSSFSCSNVPNRQFSRVLNPDYQDFDLVPLSQPGLSGTFVFSGYYSTLNNQPLYFFRPASATATYTNMVMSFDSETGFQEEPTGMYFTLGAVTSEFWILPSYAVYCYMLTSVNHLLPSAAPTPPRGDLASMDEYWLFTEGSCHP